MTTPRALALIPASPLSPTTLPRARAVTDALLAPPGDRVAEPFAVGLGVPMTRALSPLAIRPRPPRSRQATITGYTLRALVDPAHQPTPFRWSPRTARRALGVPAVQALVRGDCRTPVAAVRRVVDETLARARLDGSGRRSLGGWLAGVPAGGRALVAAEAVTWATALFGALEWHRLDGVDVGIDHWWDVPGAPGVALRGRAEVRTLAHGHPALFCMMNGRPQPTSRAELQLAALVDVLRQPTAAAPSRVVGWWPAAGRVVVVPVTEGSLTATRDLVLQAVDAGPPDAPHTAGRAA